MRIDVAFACGQFQVSERQASKLLGMDRGSYRYEPRPDRNAQLREDLVTLAGQNPRSGYRRLHALLVRNDQPVNVMHIYRLHRTEGLAVRRLKRKRLSRVAIASYTVRSNQEWALDFAADTLANGRGIRVVAVVDAFTRGNLSLEVDTCLSSRRVTRTLEEVIRHRGKPDGIRCDDQLNASGIFVVWAHFPPDRCERRSSSNAEFETTLLSGFHEHRSPLGIVNTRSAAMRSSQRLKQRRDPVGSIIYEVEVASTAHPRGIDPPRTRSSKKR